MFLRLASQGIGYLTVLGPAASEPIKIKLLQHHRFRHGSDTRRYRRLLDERGTGPDLRIHCSHGRTCAWSRRFDSSRYTRRGGSVLSRQARGDSGPACLSAWKACSGMADEGGADRKRNSQICRNSSGHDSVACSCSTWLVRRSFSAKSRLDCSLYICRCEQAPFCRSRRLAAP